MRYKVAWSDPEQTILHQTYLAGADAEDFYSVVKQSSQLMAQVDHPVDLIIDIERMADMLSFRFFSVARYVAPLVPSNQRFVVIVSTSHVMTGLARIANRFIRHGSSRLAFAQTIPQALDEIRAFRAKLPAEESAPAR
ncbi:MAG: hypothetical protein SNJ80_13235 [Anaerolinea sp.]